MDDLINRISKFPLMWRLLALVGAIVLVVLINYFVFILPLDGAIANSEKQIKQLDTQLVQKRAIAKDLTRYRVEVERLKQRLNEALTLLPNEAEIPELLQKIAALVEQSDCTMSNFEPQGETIAGFYAKIPVKMSIRGNFHSIATFFDKVSKLPRIVNVTDINLDCAAKSTKLGSCGMENKKVVLKTEFLATTFKFVERKAAPPAPAKKLPAKKAP